MTVLATHTSVSYDGPTTTTQNVSVKLTKARQINYMYDDDGELVYRVQYIVNDVMRTMDFPVESYIISIMRGE